MGSYRFRTFNSRDHKVHYTVLERRHSIPLPRLPNHGEFRETQAAPLLFDLLEIQPIQKETEGFGVGVM